MSIKNAYLPSQNTPSRVPMLTPKRQAAEIPKAPTVRKSSSKSTSSIASRTTKTKRECVQPYLIYLWLKEWILIVVPTQSPIMG